MADFVNNNYDETVPIIRVKAGIYLIGNRRVTAKILNVNLVVRIGGGYSSIKEYV